MQVYNLKFYIIFLLKNTCRCSEIIIISQTATNSLGLYSEGEHCEPPDLYERCPEIQGKPFPWQFARPTSATVGCLDRARASANNLWESQAAWILWSAACAKTDRRQVVGCRSDVQQRPSHALHPETLSLWWDYRLPLVPW